MAKVGGLHQEAARSVGQHRVALLRSFFIPLYMYMYTHLNTLLAARASGCWKGNRPSFASILGAVESEGRREESQQTALEIDRSSSRKSLARDSHGVVYLRVSAFLHIDNFRRTREARLVIDQISGE